MLDNTGNMHSSKQQQSLNKLKSENKEEPGWGNLKTNNTSRISLRILMIHDSEAQVVINEMFLIFALQR